LNVIGQLGKIQSASGCLSVLLPCLLEIQVIGHRCFFTVGPDLLFSSHGQTFPAGTLELRLIGARKVAALAAYESAVRVTDHRPELIVQNTIGATNHYVHPGHSSETTLMRAIIKLVT
jgi:hypothetical protein